MLERLQELYDEAAKKVDDAVTLQQLNDVRVAYLGKKGPITELMKGMGSLSADERPKVGQKANEVRESLTKKIEEKEAVLEKEELNNKLKNEQIDVTLPGRPVPKGARHPLTSVVETIEDVFIGMGFTVAEGPEVETDYYNFESLNLPKHHPARDMQDTFFITSDLLLRTQTSPVQTRSMEKHRGQGPVKIICPGKVYRRDEDDATHSHQFMQIEGLVVDEGIRMSDLKGIFATFVKQYFGEDRDIRLRPSFFPFTEPSAELDISCAMCNGEGCRTCKHTGWIEVLGAGMVHPNVLEMGGFDPEKYTGFAFGMGVERFAMLKYGIDDIRHFYTNDARFLRQFARE
ncbi:phenylalanine--tRNA ligase subunit alpha [Salisediminibacterium halotolerans]|uniref:phenylalanine--tRNA ligase subunit alpha n=1 Tax=Salisediminibacterium halotolerans TaxID=517425 RepID=UPI000EB00BC9|nr:phenylalanine--tRNA ligase subunit alpha [Salisediminibacterium halotolerans]RLJ80848.1 phenylalanyl-tRNA synthetase alpha subunit [Actinophytocola xinjiangensis]RPE84053.1 phenylalanyl-tRNA synthetase alpha subunit [Salisediminibacterium halotolerans]TWG37795.1 phenylalanyl-tRNA synthetase alpha subunit [Salisediminibacterium halotolerans]GEL08547.1 phenylalanine--tRNA ligase alpha subunit [Salisediminibacterium halotolerans]